MNYKGAQVICSDTAPGGCVVVQDGFATAYFQNVAAAIAYLDMTADDQDQNNIRRSKRNVV